MRRHTLAAAAVPARRFLPARCINVLLWLAAALAGAGATPATPATSTQPNIILILTDDQDVQLNSLAYMPNLQALLASQGTGFDNFFVPLSLCCPSRTTILRGQYPHNSQVLTNALPLGGFEKVYAENLEANTVATVLHGAGYRTVLLGKYLNGYPDTAGPTYIPPGWDEWYSPAAGNPYSEYNYTLNENGMLVKYGGTAADYLTDVVYARAVDFILRAAVTPAQPLFVYFATYAPHAPSTPAPRHANLFLGLRAPRPASFNEADVSDKPAYIATKPLLTAAQIATIDTHYRKRIQALQAVDEALAGILNTLAATGRLANTYVFFSSDNGFHMGEHRLQPGKYTPYETDIHVPLLVRGPGVRTGVAQPAFAANVDLAETFAELAGVAPLPFSDGRSLVPLLHPASGGPWRQAFLLEEFGSGQFILGDEPDAANPDSSIGVREPPDAGDLAAAPASIPSYYGFQAPGYKYVEYEDGEKELYVLTADPYELHNQASKVAPGIAAQLAAYVRTLDTCTGDSCRSAEELAPPKLLTADFTISPSGPISAAPVSFTATATGTAPYTISWDLAGNHESGSLAVKTFAPGVFAITLQVSDAIGAQITVTKSLSVQGRARQELR